AVCIVYIIILFSPFIILLGSKGNLIVDVSNDKFGISDMLNCMIRYMPITLIPTIFNLIITVLLAYPLTATDSKGKVVYEIFLIILLVMGQGGIHEYLYYARLRILGTVYPYIFNNIFSIMNIVVLGAMYSSEYSFAGFKEYIRRVSKPAIAL